ncbi:YtxH domain-containing protein [Enterococcus diestrammenae]|uniref:YtxH domain-containing protein n=1 Tax=Enterococcus diestrammenae TaxID=1155073 RepID=UPI0022E70E41|nr:YtxH domain-containing protein [Enterococcus diestrammenae]
MIKNFIKGLLFGSVLGGGLGLLFAPRSGNDTRRKLSLSLEEATRTQEDLNRSLKRFTNSAKETQTLITKMIPELMTGLQKDIEAFQFQAEPRIKRIQKQAEVLNEHIAQLETAKKHE